MVQVLKVGNSVLSSSCGLYVFLEESFITTSIDSIIVLVCSTVRQNVACIVKDVKIFHIRFSIFPKLIIHKESS